MQQKNSLATPNLVISNQICLKTYKNSYIYIYIYIYYVETSNLYTQFY